MKEKHTYGPNDASGVVWAFFVFEGLCWPSLAVIGCCGSLWTCVGCCGPSLTCVGLRWLDCPRSGPGPCGPRTGPDPTGRSEGPGQILLARPRVGRGQGQLLGGPALGVGPCPDPDPTCEHILFLLEITKQENIVSIEEKKKKKKTPNDVRHIV